MRRFGRLWMAMAAALAVAFTLIQPIGGPTPAYACGSDYAPDQGVVQAHGPYGENRFHSNKGIIEWFCGVFGLVRGI